GLLVCWSARRANKKRRPLPPLALRASCRWGGYDAITPRTGRPARRAGSYAYSRCISAIGRITNSIDEAVAPVDLARLPESLAVLLCHDAPLDSLGRAQLKLDQPGTDLGMAEYPGRCPSGRLARHRHV